MVQYATAAQLKGYLAEPVIEDRYDALLDRALSAASDRITDYADRLFTKEASDDTPSVKLFSGGGTSRLYVRDFYTPAGDFSEITVKVDWGNDGTYEDTLTYSTEWTAGPHGQRSGYPYYYLDIHNLSNWPQTARPSVEVTAPWGWEATPAIVEDICLQMASELFKRKDAPFGVAGFDDLGVVRLSATQMRVLDNLKHLRRFPVLME